MPTSSRAGGVFPWKVEWGNVMFSIHSPVPFNVLRWFHEIAGRCGHRPLHSHRTAFHSTYPSSIFQCTPPLISQPTAASFPPREAEALASALRFLTGSENVRDLFILADRRRFYFCLLVVPILVVLVDAQVAQVVPVLFLEGGPVGLAANLGVWALWGGVWPIWRITEQ